MKCTLVQYHLNTEVSLISFEKLQRKLNKTSYAIITEHPVSSDFCQTEEAGEADLKSDGVWEKMVNVAWLDYITTINRLAGLMD